MRRSFVRTATLIICIIVGVGILRSVYSLSQKKGILAKRQQVLNQLMVKNKQLQQELKEVTSSGFIEQAARDKLGLVREGETVVIMDKVPGGTDNQKNPAGVPSWKQWWSLFF